RSLRYRSPGSAVVGLGQRGHWSGTCVMPGPLDRIELAPLVTQIRRQPQHGSDTEQQEAEEAPRDDVRERLGRISAAAHPQPSRENGDNPAENGRHGSDTIPLIPSPPDQVHRNLTPKRPNTTARTNIAAAAAKNTRYRPVTSGRECETTRLVGAAASGPSALADGSLPGAPNAAEAVGDSPGYEEDKVACSVGANVDESGAVVRGRPSRIPSGAGPESVTGPTEGGGDRSPSPAGNCGRTPVSTLADPIAASDRPKNQVTLGPEPDALAFELTRMPAPMTPFGMASGAT